MAPSVQQLTAGEEAGSEDQRELVLQLKIRYFGKPWQGWVATKSLLRVLRLNFGRQITVHLLNGEEVTDERSES